jgi:uncharacterized protein
MADAAAQPPPPASGPPSFSYFAVFSNCPLVAAVLAFAIAQSIKVLTTWYVYRPPGRSRRPVGRQQI